jgi:formyl-CoA transferase
VASRCRSAIGGRLEGEGQMVDVALYESVFNLMESLVPEFDHAGVVRERTGGALPGIVPSNTYTTRDGENIVIAGNGDAIFKRLMLAMGRFDLAGDAQLERNDGRVQRTQEIDDAIQAWCATQDIDSALTVLKAADVPAGKIYSVRDMMVDPQFLAREMFEQHQFADGTPVKLPAISPKLSATPGLTQWIGPALGQHNDEVLRSLGYSDDEIAAMKRDGVL